MRGVLSDAAALDEALSYLSKKDKKLAAVIRKVRPEPIKQRNFDFASIVSVITSQQLSGRAAETIYGRIVSLCDGTVTPKQLEAVNDEQLRACGISYSKIGFIRSLQIQFSEQPLLIDKIAGLPVDEAITALKKFKGVGDWTASILLLFNLQHPDIFPVGDVSINKAIFEIYGVEPSEHSSMNVRWKPYRSVVSIILWRWIDSK